MTPTQERRWRVCSQGHIAIISLHRFTPLTLILKWVPRTHSPPTLRILSMCASPTDGSVLLCLKLRTKVKTFKENPCSKAILLYLHFCTWMPQPWISSYVQQWLYFLSKVKSLLSALWHEATPVQRPTWLIPPHKHRNMILYSSSVFSSWLKMTKWDQRRS